MSEAWDNELLDELRDLFSEAGLSVSIEEIGGRNVLVTEFEGIGVAEDGNISIEHITDDITCVSVMFSIASDLDEKASDDITAVLPYLNKYLSIGHFGITRPDGYFYFNNSFIIDENAEREIVLKMIVSSFDIAAATANEAAELTLPVINGEKPVSGLMNEDISIVQF